LSKPELSFDELTAINDALITPASYQTLVAECGRTKEKDAQAMSRAAKGLFPGA
jgi:hypothetical protein